MQRDRDPIVIYCINNEAMQGKIITKNKRRNELVEELGIKKKLRTRRT